MSRCFPYPYPGYAGKCASNEALICTIKPQRVSEKTKSEKKNEKKKKEKKERKREGKANGTISSDKKVLNDEKMFDAGDKYGKYPEVCHVKQQESSYELMEKSSLTEEHGKPCCSSDSTENSAKRKRQSPPLPGNNNARSGTVIRIVLNSRKKDDSLSSSTSKPASLWVNTGKPNYSSLNADVAVQTPVSKLRISPPTIVSTQQPVISQKSSAIENKQQQLPVRSKDHESSSKTEKKLPRPLRKYNALFENFALPPLEAEPEDDDWLFVSKKQEAGRPLKRSKLHKDDAVNCGIPALQPRALFLSEADIYALPFTVPF